MVARDPKTFVCYLLMLYQGGPQIVEKNSFIFLAEGGKRSYYEIQQSILSSIFRENFWPQLGLSESLTDSDM